MKNIKVSFVIPMYNVDKYLKQCLDSILYQTYQNYEVILIDDGSSDDTVKIAEEYVNSSEKFFLYKQPNGGASVGRNNGLAHAVGDYVFFLDSDDYLLKNALEILVEAAAKIQPDVIKFSAYTFSDNDCKLTWSVDGYKLRGVYEGVLSGKDFLHRSIENQDAYLVNCGHVFARRMYIENYSLRFFEGIIHEDVLFHWQLMTLASKVLVINQPLSCRRYREGSVMERGKWDRRIWAMSKIIDETDSFINQHDEINRADTDWFLNLYAQKILQFYMEMTAKERKSRHVGELLSVVRRQMRNHQYWGKRGIRIFSFSPELYRICSKIR